MYTLLCLPLGLYLVCMESRNDYFKRCDVNIICTNVNSIFSVLINFMYMYMYIYMHVCICIPFAITCLYSYYYQRYSACNILYKPSSYVYVTCTCIYIHALYDSVYQLLLSKIAVYSVNLAYTCMLPYRVVDPPS